MGQKYDVLNEIGASAYASVFKVKNLNTGIDYVLKINRSSSTLPEYMLSNEVKILSKFMDYKHRGT